MNIEIINSLKERAKEMLKDNYDRKIGDEAIYTIICELENFYTAYEKEKEKNKEYEKQLDLDYAEEKIKEAYIDGTNVAHNLCNKKWVEIIQAQIQELENERKDLVYAQPFVDGQIGVLKRVLKRGEE